MRWTSSLLMLAAAAAGAPVFAADANANAGKMLFRQQCALCHSAQPDDGGGAQGPNLQGLLGRAAASNRSFSYTQALRNSHLTWNAATLDHFLAAPTSVVPGSAMVIAVPSAADRQNLIAYFQAVADGTFKEAPRPAFPMPPRQASSHPAGSGEGDWRKDYPGRVHRIDVAQLPAPYASSSATNFPHLVPRPADAQLHVPEGFKVEVFTSDVQAPRAMRLAPNGDIFL
ncbi:MAG TPA: c-type cytochrome, partial [Steroidobacteraceae bacterium]|nr:c-type cytochrome [Steroidobacteraceae bacterium]